MKNLMKGSGKTKTNGGRAKKGMTIGIPKKTKRKRMKTKKGTLSYVLS